MCGIAGMLSGSFADDQKDRVVSMIGAQLHRGPDHQATTTIRTATATLELGHCRLMIVDLTPGSHQPLWDHERRCCLVFNGEIYNHLELRRELASLGHRFETRSDTEVILEAYKAWGVESFEHLNGMFAFGLYDTQSERLLLVRDRFGVKPLHWMVHEGRLWFASTAAAIAGPLRLEPDLGYLARGIRYWVYEDEDRSPYLGLRAVRAGHWIEASIAGERRVHAREHGYYRLVEGVGAVAERLAGLSEPELHDRFARLIDRAIDVRLPSDAAVGVSLSGGLDSSTVAAVSHTKRRAVGFTFGHPAAPATEGSTVLKLGSHTGMPIHFVHPKPGTVKEAFFRALSAQEAPFPSGSIVGQYLVYEAARRAGFRVVLGGQESDEIFMGYRKFQLFHLRQLLHRRRLWAAMAFASSVVPEVLAELPRATPYWRLRHRYLRASGMPTGLSLPEPDPSGLMADPDQPLWIRQAHDIQHASLPTLLRYEDRSSMAHGVESRLPFLDHRLVEFALALPVSLKLRGGYRKWIVREFARGRIPEAIRCARYKRGFDVEQGAWIEDGLGESIRRRLAPHETTLRPYLADGERIERLLSDDRLKHDGSAFAEATTLLWLAEGIGGGEVSSPAPRRTVEPQPVG